MDKQLAFRIFLRYNVSSARIQSVQREEDLESAHCDGLENRNQILELSCSFVTAVGQSLVGINMDKNCDSFFGVIDATREF